MNQEFIKEQQRLEIKKKKKLEKPFFNNQGFNILNMKYIEGPSGNILK